MKKIKISEEQLTRVLKNILEQETADDEVLRVLDQADMIRRDEDDFYDAEEDIEDIEGQLDKLLSPEEIVQVYF